MHGRTDDIRTRSGPGVLDDPGPRGLRPGWLLVLALPLLACGRARADVGGATRDVAGGGGALDRALAGDADPMIETAHTSDDGDGGDGWSFDAIPATDLYRRYLADPRRPRFIVNRLSMLDSSIDRGGTSRVAIGFGGRYNFVRLHPDGDPELGFQFDAEAGILAHFDLSHSLDNIAWEGYYGFGLSWRPLRRLAFRLAMNHDSAHLGDEYIHETGRERVNYTREELALGVSWEPIDVVRLYAEAGWAYHMGNSDLERGRVQAGIEYETAEPVLWGAHLFAGLDAVAWQENGWEPSLSAMTGLVWHFRRFIREYRIGLQYYDGRSLFGEFFEERERFVGVGLWFDL